MTIVPYTCPAYTTDGIATAMTQTYVSAHMNSPEIYRAEQATLASTETRTNTTHRGTEPLPSVLCASVCRDRVLNLTFGLTTHCDRQRDEEAVKDGHPDERDASPHRRPHVRRAAGAC